MSDVIKSFRKMSLSKKVKKTAPPPRKKGEVEKETLEEKSHLLTEFYIDRFAVAANTVEHPGLDAAPTHGVRTQLTCTPV